MPTEALEDALEDQRAATLTAQREEELRVGARALTRRLRQLENRAKQVRASLELVESGDSLLTLTSELEDLAQDVTNCRWRQYALVADAAGGLYTVADVASWCKRAEAMDAAHPALDYQLLVELLHLRKVPNVKFRECYEAAREQARSDIPAGQSLAVGEGTQREIASRLYSLLREAEEADGKEYGAASLMHDGQPQTRYLERLLGICTLPASAPDRRPTLRLFVRYEQAVALARLFGLAPTEAGI